MNNSRNKIFTLNSEMSSFQLPHLEYLMFIFFYHSVSSMSRFCHYYYFIARTPFSLVLLLSLSLSCIYIYIFINIVWVTTYHHGLYIYNIFVNSFYLIFKISTQNLRYTIFMKFILIHKTLPEKKITNKNIILDN